MGMGCGTNAQGIGVGTHVWVVVQQECEVGAPSLSLLARAGWNTLGSCSHS